MNVKNGQGLSTWDIILGNADFVTTFGQPADPFMIESPSPRTGKNPITGAPLLPPSMSAGGSAINGHEFSKASPGAGAGLTDDLQYACIFPLAKPFDCSGAWEKSLPACDCTNPVNDNPLCDANPNDGGKRTLQTHGKAYPGRRELAIVRALGPQGIVGSLCPQQMNDPTQLSFGFRATMRSIIDRLKPALAGQCLPRVLTPDGQGRVPCHIVEARNTGSGACDCNTPSRSPVPAADQCLVEQAKNDPLFSTAQWNCFCAVDQATGADLTACQGDAHDPPSSRPATSRTGGVTSTPPWATPRSSPPAP